MEDPASAADGLRRDEAVLPGSDAPRHLDAEGPTPPRVRGVHTGSAIALHLAGIAAGNPRHAIVSAMPTRRRRRLG